MTGFRPDDEALLGLGRSTWIGLHLKAPMTCGYRATAPKIIPSGRSANTARTPEWPTVAPIAPACVPASPARLGHPACPPLRILPSR